MVLEIIVIFILVTFCSEKSDPRGYSFSPGCFKAKSTRTWVPSDKGVWPLFLIRYGHSTLKILSLNCYDLVNCCSGVGDKSGDFPQCC